MVRDRERPARRQCGLLDELARDRRHDLVVRVRLVELEHRELGRVRAVGALVAEVAVHLEHALEAADDGALEEQLGRDAQVEVDVERVRVRDERPRGSAAGQRLEHRRLDLEVAAAGEALTDGRHHRHAGPRGLLRLRADDEVHVALAHAGLLAQRPMRHGQGAKGLGGHAPLVGQHGQLAALGRDDLAGDEDVVADVDEVLPGGQLLLPDVREGEHGLDLGAVARAQGGEAELAGVPGEDDATGDADAVTGGRVDRQVGEPGPDVRDGRRDRQADAVGLHAPRGELLALLAPDPHLLGQVVVRIGVLLEGAGGVGRHNAQG